MANNTTRPVVVRVKSGVKAGQSINHAVRVKSGVRTAKQA
jgi:hypothetical protein